jgi:hypothetical protein
MRISKLIVDPDLDPTFNFDSDPDPIFNFDVDSGSYYTRREKF